MGLTQRIVTSLCCPSVAESIEQESREWMLRCSCGSERSVWEAGGIRYRAAGNPVRMVWCPTCQRVCWHMVYRKGQEPKGLAEFQGTDGKKPPIRGKAAESFMRGQVARTLGLTFVIIGAILLGIAIGSKAPHWYFKHNAHTTMGEVHGYQQAGDRGPAVVKYRVEGQLYFTKTWLSTNPQAYQRGEKLRVLYRPDNPTEARIDTFLETSLFATIFGGVGAVFALVGGGFLRRSRRLQLA